MLLCALIAVPLAAQQDESSLANLVTKGEVTVEGQPRQYIVRHLPPSSFPNLPLGVAGELTERGCLIPQTYEAHRPENVVRGSFERAGSVDWAVLCSRNGSVSLLVFFADTPAKPAVLGSESETSRLEAHNSSRVLGFNWGIGAASPDAVHDAQIGLSPRPARLDHDAVADSVVERRTVYHYFSKGEWSLVDLPD